MFWSIQNYVGGYLELQYTGEECTRFINLCHNNHLNIWNIQCENNIVSMCCDKKDFKKMKQIRRKCRGHLKIQNRKGCYFFLKTKKKHACYLLGICIFFIVGKILSLYIWNISFEGNYSNTSVELTNFLKTHSYAYGMKKSDVDCEKLEYLLRTNYPDVTWVSVEINGTKLKIHMKENFDGYFAEKENRSYDLVADATGIITDIVTRTGVPMVKAGDSVEVGQVLVSGILDNYGDNETFVSRKFVQADADIYADVIIPYEDKFPMSYEEKYYTGETHTVYSLRFMHKNLYFSLPYQQYKSVDSVSSEKQVCLFKDFYFPVYTGKMLIREYTAIMKQYTAQEATAIATENLERFIEKLEEKGIQIIEKNVTIESNHEQCIGSGQIKVNQKLGCISYINEEEHAKFPSEENTE